MNAQRKPLYKRFDFGVAVVVATYLGVSVVEASTLSVSGACTNSESWKLDSDSMGDWKTLMEQSIGGKFSPARGFAEGLAYRQSHRASGERLLGEYWIARSVFSAGLVHGSAGGFRQIVAQSTDDASPITLAAQQAALECLTRIAELYPSLPLPALESKKLGALGKNDTVTRAAFYYVQQGLSEGRSPADLKAYAAVMEESSVEYKLSEASILILEKKKAEAALLLKALIESGQLSAKYASFEDSARLLLGRLQYENKDFVAATDEYKRIKKNSNELAKALTELSWAQLREYKYGDAIGTAINLQSGAMRRTFSPEALMVMSMAMNELCQYPDALKAVGTFRKIYETSYDYLKQIPDSGYYAESIRFLKRESKVPEKVGSEWIRSPLFITRQEEINQLFRETKAAGQFVAQAKMTQKEMVKALLAKIAELKPRYEQFQAKRMPGDALPQALVNDLNLLKRDVTYLQRFTRAAKPWKKLSEFQTRKAKETERTLVAHIERDLKRLTERMRDQLDEVAENIQLVEVEVFHEAPKDLIWQNVHPDYKDKAKKIAAGQAKVDRGDLWSWGKVAGGIDGNQEIWEDELGSFRADLYDNCETKAKYLQVSKKEN